MADSDLTPADVATATGCPPGNVETHWPLLLDALQSVGLASRNSQCGLAATVAIETGRFVPVSENLNFSALALQSLWPKRFPTPEFAAEYERQPVKIANYIYANRMGNGDTASMDGWRYRGRGFIQLTGKDNYAGCGAALSVDLETDPGLLLEPTISARAAIWFWQLHHVADACNVADWRRVRQLVNGGLVHYAEFETTVKRFGLAA